MEKEEVCKDKKDNETRKGSKRRIKRLPETEGYEMKEKWKAMMRKAWRIKGRERIKKRL